MADKEKSSSPAATAKGTAPSTSKIIAHYRPFFKYLTHRQKMR